MRAAKALADWSYENPLKALLIGAGAAAAGVALAWYLTREEEEGSVFRKAPTVSFLESTGDHVDVRSLRLARRSVPRTGSQFLVSAIKKAGAEGLFDAATVKELERKFLAHCKKTSKGTPVLDWSGFVEVCHEIGITDGGIVRTLFSKWDVDKSGEIEFNEFLHVLAFSKRADTSTKLRSAFDLMDTNHDGHVNPEEMARFFRTVYRSIGKPKTPSQVQALVGQVFAKLDKDRSQAIDVDEFLSAAHTVHLSTGDTLTALIDAMMDRFNGISSEKARHSATGEAVDSLRRSKTADMTPEGKVVAVAPAVAPATREDKAPPLSRTTTRNT
jgi:Ca2+-binding EF-hand superfamily protein